MSPERFLCGQIMRHLIVGLLTGDWSGVGRYGRLLIAILRLNRIVRRRQRSVRRVARE